MPISELEKLEKLCHGRAVMLKAREYITGKLKYSQESIILTLNDGIDVMSELILEVKHNGK